MEAAEEALAFESVVLEDLSFGAQARLMARTGVLIGVHGAGLTNMLFLPVGAAVVELLPARCAYPLYERAAAALGHLHYFRYVARVSETRFERTAAARFAGWSTRRCFEDETAECAAASKDAHISVDTARLVGLLDETLEFS